MKTKKGKVFVISHTHWDREWYQPFQKFRYRLVKMIDELIEILEKDKKYKCFNLDGQTVVLEDYLDIKPENKEKLINLVKSNKLGIGPWYVQMDEFLVDGESIIRNLAYGKELSKEFGGIQFLGYLPDSFGHNSQIPQILRGFNIETCLLWRGISGDDLPWEFIWEGADGSTLMSYRLPEPIGYCNAAVTPDGKAVDNEMLLNLKREFSENTKTGLVLLMDGCDHKRLNISIKDTLTYMHRKDVEYEYEQVLLNRLSEEIKAKYAEFLKELPIVKGELRSVNKSRRGVLNFILPNVLSSRYNNKKANWYVMHEIEKVTEPLAVFNWLKGQPYPEAFLDKTWKLILKNHAHDSIGGCSTDEVHRDVKSRFEWASQINDSIVKRSLMSLSDNSINEAQDHVFIYNPAFIDSDGCIRITVDVPAKFLTLDKNGLVFKEENGKILDSQLISIEKRIKALDHFGNSAPIYEVYEIEAVVKKKLSGMSFTKLKLETCRKGEVKSYEKEPEKLENKYLTVEILENGEIKVTDKKTAKTVITNHFVDTGDNGDGYVYSIPKNNVEISSLKKLMGISIEKGLLLDTMTLNYTIEIPKKLVDEGQTRSKETEELKIVTQIMLKKDSKRLKFKTKIENHCDNHKVFVRFIPEDSTEEFFYTTPFDLVRKKNKEFSDERKPIHWIENPPTAFPNQGLFGELYEGKEYEGYAVANKGVYEFVKTEDSLNLTLLRSVGHIGSPYRLSCMKRNAGPSIETPQAQMHGIYHFDYCLFFIFSEEELIKECERYQNIPVAISSSGNQSYLNEPFSIETRTTKLTTVKRSNDGEGIILRFVNLGSELDYVKIQSNFEISSAYNCKLDETVIKQLDVDSGISIQLKAKEIKTIKLVLKEVIE
ncbi:MAG: glycoside hydrolase family 38 C-terminal domain-containing protein [Kosmotogaceae bacterium]